MVTIKKSYSLLLFCIPLLAAAQPATQHLSFVVTMNNPEEHRFQVTMHLDQLPGDSVDLCLPVWTPGYYQLMDFVRNLSDFSVKDGRFRWIKPDSATWRLYARKGTPLTISYTIKAEKRFVANPYLGADHAYILPGGVFLYPRGRLTQPVKVRVVPAPGWDIATGLERHGDSYYARDFDQLYDAPILAGKLETLPVFTVRGVPHIFTGIDLGDFDKTAFVHDLQQVVEAGVAMMGDIPYDHYVFLAIGDGNGGIEHANSCSLSFSGKHFSTEAGRRRMLSFIAHEYFHLYNVKCIRPVESGPFDYQQENRTNLLWVSEGFTVYYEYLLNKRAGLITPDELFRSLEKNIAAYENTTGHSYQSLTEASYATWSYGPFGGSLERSISYYDKGPAVAMLLDLAIRHETANRHSLDDVMVLLYRKFYQQKKRGFSDAEFRQACETIAGASLDDVFSYATTTRDLDYNKYLAYAGLTLERQEKVFHIHPLPAADSLQNAIRDSWMR